MASFRTQPCNILVHDGRDTRDFGCRCCKNIRRGNFTKTLAWNSANGQETSLYSRCAQRNITCFYLASPIRKASVLAYIFCISKSTVGKEIYHVVPILFTNYRRFIKWHSIRQWNQFLDTFPSFPNAVGLIDGTIHQIRHPSGPLQVECYRSLPQIGHGRARDLPRRACILADAEVTLRGCLL